MNISEFAGTYLPSEGTTCFGTMDGSDVAEWLENNGERVVRYFDTGQNGIAITASGYSVSTNGYVTNRKQED